MEIKTATSCKIKDLGLISYNAAYDIQKAHVDAVCNGAPQTVLFCEHPSVFTLGRLAKEENFLMPQDEILSRGVQICHINRGGDVTLHSPGQLVIYPILDLTNLGKDLRSYMHTLEQVAIDLLSDFDIVANRFEGQTGVWVKDQKIASIGIGVRKWISFHGLAINVNTDLDLFSMIRPCNLDVEMTSVSKIKGRFIIMDEVKKRIVGHLSHNFNLKILNEDTSYRI